MSIAPKVRKSMLIMAAALIAGLVGGCLATVHAPPGQVKKIVEPPPGQLKKY